MSDRHNGQRRCMRCSSSAHRLQKRECPHGTSASGALGSSRHTSQTARSAVITGGVTTSDGADEDGDDVEVVAASASSTSYVSVLSSSLLFTSCSCSVGRLSAMWLTTDYEFLFVPTVHARCKLIDASFYELAIQHRCLLLCPSYLVAVCQPVILSYSVLAHFTQMLQEYKKLGWETLTRRRNAA